ncbi:peroxisomal membrane protein [Niveomyces insectorum RCEF 264]|uniref:Peroxisomal membrane protein n=1 Tax=Niveomyces insectorum RCEF 264 TaxID=1081102 RepID=A0A167ZSR6_9HYPO|nr:peroxisomal membrane protein [Niveomyces insectorum RCEF 264]
MSPAAVSKPVVAADAYVVEATIATTTTSTTRSPAVAAAVAAPDPANDSVAHAVAGAGGGILATVLTYPLITLSTRAQVEARRAGDDTDAAAPAGDASRKVPSFVQAAKRIVAREGVRGLYAGLDSAIVGIGVTNFVYYYWYEWTRAALSRRAAGTGARARVAGQLTTLESMFAGALAGSATVVLTNPIWVVNTRMTTRQRAVGKEGVAAAGMEKETDAAAAAVSEGEGGAAGASSASPKPASSSPSTLGTLLALLREEGPRALFAGVVPALVLVANPILQYTLFEQLKNVLQRRRPITPGIAFVLGALTKLFATAITYPYITVKSRMHVAANRSADGNGGVLAALRRVVQTEGYGGLYRGIGPKITQSVLTAAFLFAFKDVLYAQTVRLRSTMAAKRLRA